MPIQLTEENGGKVLIVRVSGKLDKADFAALMPDFNRLVARHGKLRILFEMVDFHGWHAAAAWEDIKFDFAHYAHVERVAMVGETRWQHGMALLFKPFTKAKVRYFTRADAARAREWVGEGVAPAQAVAAGTPPQ